MSTWLDAGLITATGTALAAILTAASKLAQVLRERRECTCRHQGCDQDEAPAHAT